MLCQAQFMPSEERYSVEEFLSFMASDHICEQMCKAAVEVQDMGGDGYADPLEKPTIALSGTASNETVDLTQAT